jgi:hypothetical protein
MAFDFDASDDIDSTGSWLMEPGIYHALVQSTNDYPTNAKGMALSAFKIHFQILAGTTPGQEGKTVDLLFWNPKDKSADGGKFARRKQTRMLVAVGLIDSSGLGRRSRIELTDATSRQCIMQIEFNERDGRFYPDLHYANVWHVDDPEAAKCPRSEESLALIPPQHRRTTESFAKKTAPPAPAPAPNPGGGAIDLSGI